MKKIKALIATLSLLFVLTTVVVPTYAMAEDPQGQAQPAPQQPAEPPPLWLILLLLGLAF